MLSASRVSAPGMRMLGSSSGGMASGEMSLPPTRSRSRSRSREFRIGHIAHGPGDPGGLRLDPLGPLPAQAGSGFGSGSGGAVALRRQAPSASSAALLVFTLGDSGGRARRG